MINFLKKRKVVVTHNGSFHTDDVFAVATLLIYYKNRIKIIRTRDEKLIQKADIVLDVGGIYNPETKRFDHHQKEGAGVRESGIPYASFGLIWKHFGLEICKNNEEVFKYIDEKVCSGIDAGDNGFDIEKNTERGIYEIGAILGAFNPSWEEEGKEDKHFKEAIKFAKGLLQREIQSAGSYIKGRKIVEEAYKNAPDKRFIETKERIPRYIFQFVLCKYEEPLFFISPTSKKNIWKGEAIRKSKETYEPRKPFKKEYGALNDEELQKVSGVEDAVFCHRNLFICSARSKEGVLKLIEDSLK